ncbi:MAG TPA: ribosome silencing factor [Planctomycetaceae bacterium]|nr:ribosome silencing factor [Gimesia sp.]HAH46745.1 ribosome silencing factor [Planctomycetaceae bacterium]HBL43228.1 ribosome silencing factor [Planctomycetaceae bacterium]
MERACLCAKTCEDFKGKEIVVLDVAKITPLFDYFIIATASNQRQSNAIAEEIRVLMKRESTRRRNIEGKDSDWILGDYGDIVLHLFTEEARELYDLERLWADAKKVDWKSFRADSH